jgi:ABC-2 type transport system permease protein
VRLYLEVAVRSLRRYLAYRAAALAGLVTNAVFGAVIAAVYIAFFQNVDGGERVGGFAEDEILSYVWIAQGLLAVVAVFGWWDIARSIRTGDVVADLMKPFDYYRYWLAQDIGRAASQVLLRFIPTFTLGALVFDLALPATPERWLAFAASVVLAALVSFGIRFLFNISAFWLTDVQGIHTFYIAVTGFFSGQLVPLVFFPDWLRVVAELLPFRAMVMSPVEVFLGQGDIALILGRQALWFAVLTLGGYALLSQAVRKVVVQGG